MTLQEENTALVQRCYQAFGMGNMTGLFAMMADTIEWHSGYVDGISLNGSYRGKAELGELFQKIGSDITISAFTPLDFLANETKVVVLGQEEATVAKTQKKYQNSWVHVWEIEDEKVTRITTFNTVGNLLNAFQP